MTMSSVLRWLRWNRELPWLLSRKVPSSGQLCPRHGRKKVTMASHKCCGDNGAVMAWKRDTPCLALTVAIAVVGAAACSSSSNRSNAARDAGTEAATWGASDCSSCIDSSCAQQVQACSEEPSCAAYLTCLRKCPVAADGNVDATCAAKCPTSAGSSGEAAITSLDQCRKSGAGASCAACGGTNSDGGSDGGCDMPLLCQQCAPPQADASACVTCAQKYCCDSRDACHNDPTCAAYLTCMSSDCTAGTVAACIAFCDQAHPGGFDKYAQYLACAMVKCADGSCAPASKCQTCLNDKCANAEVACQTNEACFLASDCVGNCNGVSQCIDNCKTRYPGSEPTLDDLGTCSVSMCQNCQ